MGLTPGTRLAEVKSTASSSAPAPTPHRGPGEVAKIAKGRKVASHVNAMVVPGSGLVKHQAEQKGSTRSSRAPASNGASRLLHVLP